MSCESITAECEELANITVGFYHNYPCVMVYLKDVPSESSPPSEKAGLNLSSAFCRIDESYRATKWIAD